MQPAFNTFVHQTYFFINVADIHPIGCSMQDLMWLADANEPPAAFSLQAMAIDGGPARQLSYEQYIISGSGGTPTFVKAGHFTSGTNGHYNSPMGLPLTSLPTPCTHYVRFLSTTGAFEFQISVVPT